jgi:hypothetical protein
MTPTLQSEVLREIIQEGDDFGLTFKARRVRKHYPLGSFSTEKKMVALTMLLRATSIGTSEYSILLKLLAENS